MAKQKKTEGELIRDWAMKRRDGVSFAELAEKNPLYSEETIKRRIREFEMAEAVGLKVDLTPVPMVRHPLQQQFGRSGRKLNERMLGLAGWLKRQPGAVGVRDVAMRLGSTLPSATHAMKRLEIAGLAKSSGDQQWVFAEEVKG